MVDVDDDDEFEDEEEEECVEADPKGQANSETVIDLDKLQDFVW